MEFELVGKAGTTRQIILNALSVVDDNGVYVESRSVMFDISEQKRMKEVLERVSAEQQAMLETDLVAIVKIKNHQIIWHNKAMSRIFGYDANELAGARTRIFYPSEAAYLELSAEAYPHLHQQHTYRNQLEMIRKDGARIWVDMHGVSLNEADDTSMWILSDISTLKKYQQRLEDLAFHDALTGLPNRTLLTDRITQALSHARRLKQLLAVCFIDLDGFKPVNDIHGHEAGDLLLQTIAKRMLAMVRAHDTVARVGGDEFVILLTQLEVETDYQNVLTRMVTQINQPILLADGCEVKVGASVGVAVYPSHSTDADLLLRYADEAMYDAKHHGKNRVVLYQAS